MHNNVLLAKYKVLILIFLLNLICLLKVYIQRTKGCDHIVCLRCKTEFCYKCGGRFRDIKFIGKIVFFLIEEICV